MASFIPVSCGTKAHSWVIGEWHNYCSRCGLILEIPNARRSPKVKKKPSKAQRLREKIAERDGKECWWCILPGSENDPLTLEHVPRLARGGGWALENLRLAHKSCNENRPVLDRLEEA